MLKMKYTTLHNLESEKNLMGFSSHLSIAERLVATQDRIRKALQKRCCSLTLVEYHIVGQGIDTNITIIE